MLKSKKPLERNVLCSKCWTTITDFHSFRKNVYTAHKTLKITNKTITKEQTDCSVEEFIINKIETEDNLLKISKQIENNENLKNDKSVVDVDLQIKQEKIDNLDQNEIVDITEDKADKVISYDIIKTEPVDSSIEQNSDKHEDIIVKNEIIETIDYDIDDIIYCNDNSYTEESMNTVENIDYKVETVTIVQEIRDNEVNFETNEDIADDEENNDGEKSLDASSDTEFQEVTATGTCDIEQLKSLKAVEEEQIFAKYMPFFKCLKCKEIFKEFNEYRKHFKYQHPKFEFYVNCCERKFSLRFKLLNHLRLHYNPEIFKCQYCGECMSMEQSLFNHIRNKHKSHLEEFKKIKMSNDLRLKTMEEYEKFICINMPILGCYVCEEIFETFTLMYSHFKEKHPKDKFYITCCDSKLKNRASVVYHLREKHHDKLQQITENICNNREENIANNVEENANAFATEESNEYEDSEIKNEIIETSDYFINEFIYHKNEDNSKAGTSLEREPASHIINEVNTDSDVITKNDDTRNCDTENPKLLKALEEEKIFAKCMPSFKCYKCRKTFNEYSIFRQHFKDFHPKLQFYVTCCDKKFPVRHQLLTHLRLHYNPETYKCQYCGECLKREHYLLAHIRKMHKNIAPPEVVKKLDVAKELRMKKAQEYEDFIKKIMPILKCYVCQEEFETYTLLNNHFKDEHPKEKFYIFCCKSKLPKRALFVYHLREHHNNNLNDSKENNCGETSTVKDNENNDVVEDIENARNNTILKDNTPQPSNENSCDTHSSVIKNVLNITPDNENEDEIITDDIYNTNSNTSNNMFNDETMIDEDSLKEEEIFIFDDNSNNTNIQPNRKQISANEANNIIAKCIPHISCYKCQKTFNSFTSVRSHFRHKHPSFRFYVKCCGKKFPVRSLLANHLRLHLNPELFKCDICGKCRSSQRCLDNHKKIMHKDHVEEEIDSESLAKRREQNKKIRLQKAKKFDEIIAKVIPKIECYVCNKIFRKFLLLKDHFKKQHQLLQCYVRCCKKKLSSRHALAHHVREHHLNMAKEDILKTGNSENKQMDFTKVIDYDNEDILKPNTSKDDEFSVLDDEQLKTDSFSYLTDEEKDNLIAKYMPVISCHICNKNFGKFLSFYSHFKKEHALYEFHIRCCNLKFAKRSLLLKHLKVHINPDLYKCDICGIRKANQRNLDSHMRSMHHVEKNEPTTSSSSDDESYRTEKDTRKVQELEDFIAEKLPTIKCHVCQETFNRYSLLRNHFKKLHPLMQFYVNCCDKQILHRCSLVSHLRQQAHAERQQHKCDICAEHLTSKENLEYHKHRHENLVPQHECTICEKKFFYKESLNSHLLKHDNSTSNNLLCPYCSRRYYSKRQLQGHIKMNHTDSEYNPDIRWKPKTICEHCGEVLINKYFVRKHLIMHGLMEATPRKTYKCDICNVTLQGMDSFKRHNMAKHYKSTQKK